MAADTSSAPAAATAVVWAAAAELASLSDEPRLARFWAAPDTKSVLTATKDMRLPSPGENVSGSRILSRFGGSAGDSHIIFTANFRARARNSHRDSGRPTVRHGQLPGGPACLVPVTNSIAYRNAIETLGDRLRPYTRFI